MTQNRLNAWVLAARPRTLPAAVAPVLVGSALAFYHGLFRPGPALAALLGALLIQIGANFANDYMDYQKGADEKDRVGPLRVTTAGLISLRGMKIGTFTVFGLAALCGVYLAATSGWPVIGIGVLSILAALAYTGGPYPLGYNGLGEVFVFLFFGLAAVGGTYYVEARTYNMAAFTASIAPGCLIVGILVVNNLRDIAADQAAGKRTLAARYGAAWAQSEYTVLVVLAFLSPFLMAITGLAPVYGLVAWLTAPLALRLVQSIHRDTGKLLNRSLAGTGSLTLAFAALFSLGLVLGKYL